MDITKLFKAGFKLTAMASFFFVHIAFALPEGGQVAAGNAQISQTQNQTVINQSSQHAVINWNNFNTAKTESVLFNQPNSSAIALNRINSGLPTTFGGSLSANGQVWILNPAGVLFTSTSSVDVAGLLVTTHNITDSNFMNGHYSFDKVAGFDNSTIINNGLISAKDSGLVALVAAGVENNGVIQANLGKVHLASGSSFVLDMYGDSLINFGTGEKIQNGYVSNSGLIKADGGKVYMTARTAVGVLDNVVSMSGVIEANAVSVNQKGEIVLHGGDEGTTRVSGKLHAKGGGHIETSGAHLIIEPTTEIDAGVGGSWLVDPYNIIVDGTNSNNSGTPNFTPTGNDSHIDVALISAQLSAGTDVTLDTGGIGSPGAQFGDITFNAVMTSSGGSATLYLIAFRDVNLNAAMTTTGQNIDITAGRQINLAAPVTTTGGSLIYRSPVVIPVDVTLTTTTGNISFLSTLNGSTANTRTLTTAVTGGTLTFEGAVGNTNALLSLIASGPGTTQINGPSIRTSGAQNYGSAVTVGANTVLTSTAGSINFASTLDDATLRGHTLALNTPNFASLSFAATPGGLTPFASLNLLEPSITVDATVAAFVAGQLNQGTSVLLNSTSTSITVSSPITQTINLVPVSLTVNATTSDNINAAITLMNSGSISFSAPSGINLGANITTGGLQGYNSPVVLTAGPITLNSTASSIAFGSSISGLFGLTINAATSTTILNTNVSALTVTAPGGISLQGTSYTTVNDMTFNNTIIPAAYATLTYTTTGGGDISFQEFSQTVNNNMTVNSSDRLTFNGVADFTNSSSTLFFSALGGIFINTSFIGSQFGTTYAVNSPITLLTNTTLHSTLSNTAYGSSINGAFSLTISNNTAGNSPTLTFSQPIGNITPLTALSIYEPAGPMNINAAINVNGPVSLITSSNFSGGTITFAAPIGATSNVTSLNVHGATGLNFNAGFTATTSGNQVYNSGAQGGNNWQGPVLLGADITLTSTAGSITILRPQIVFLTGLGINSSGGARSLTLNSATGVDLQVSVGNSATLSSLTVNGVASLSNQNTVINTIGDQLYNNGASITSSPTLTSSAGDILFGGTVNGGGGLTTSVPNGKSVTFSGAVGNITALLSLTTSTTGTTFINGGQVRTSSGTQNYNNPVFIGVAANTTLGGVGTTGAININSTLDSFDATPRGLILTTTALTTLGGNLGLTNILSGITVTNSAAINVATITATALQAYLGVTTLGVANVTLNTNAGGTITFGNTINGASNLTLNTVSSGVVNFNNAIGATTALTSLSIPNSPTININTGTTSIRTVDSQTYSGPILFNSLAAINFIHTNLTAPRAIIFNNTVNRTGTSTAITITGNLALAPTASIGLSSQIASLSVSGTTLGPNVTTSGNQVYSGALMLNTDETMTSTAGSISFGSTINGDGVLGRNLTVNAATTAQFNGIVGGSVPLASLTVTAPSVITVNTSLIRTTGNQTYNSTVQFPQFVNPTFNSTVNGNMIFNAVSGSGNFQSITVNAAGTANFFGTVGFPGDGMNFIDVTAANGINITLASGQRFGANQSIFMRSNLVVNGTVSFEGVTGSFLFFGTVDGPGSLSTFMNGGVSTVFSGKIGSITPLNSLSMLANSNNHPMTFNDEIHVAGAMAVQTGASVGGPVFFNASSPVTDTMGSLSVASGFVYFNNHTITTSGNQSYGTVVPLLFLQSNTTFNSTGGSISVTGGGTINNCTVGAGNCVSGSGPFDLIMNAPAGTVTFTGAVGNTAPINNLTVSGTAALNGGSVITQLNQTYNNNVTLGTTDTLTSNAGSIIFNALSGTVQGGGGLVANVGAGQSITFSGAVGSTTALLSLATSATGTTYINGGQVRTSSGAQNYNTPVFINANTTLGGVGTTGAININSTLDSFDSTARGLTLTTTALTTLGGNLGLTNILSGITVTNSAAINVATITTTTLQAYLGVTTLGVANVTLNTNAAGTITFGNTLNGGSNLTLNTTSGGTVNFNNVIGGTTALTSLTIPNSPTININAGTTSIRTVDSQTYSGPILFNSLAAINFIHTNLTAPRAITFNNTVNRTVTSTAITITGNLAVGSSGSIGLSSLIGSLSVTGTTLGPNVTTVGNQNYAGALTLNTNETMTSTGGSITYGSTVDGDGVLARNLTAIASTTVTFSGAVGNIVPLGALTVTGSGGININGGIVNTVNNQTYNNLVTLGNNLAISAGTSGCATTNCVQFTLGTAGFAGVTGPTRNLSVFTLDASKGLTGAGIAGTVNVLGFTMGGSGGGNITPVAPYSFVGGATAVGAWNNTVLDPLATGLYCVNGNCISGTRVLNINASNDTKTYGQVFVPTLFNTTGLAPGDSITSITLVSAGSPASATVAGSPYIINASNASGPGIANHYSSIVYDFTPGFLTVNAAPLTITANNTSKTYGQTLTFAGTEFTPVGLLNSDTVTSVTLNSAGTAPTATVAGSPYSITPSAAVGTGLSNYTITYSSLGTLTVNPAALTITANNTSKTYGQNLTFAGTEFTPVGLLNSDTVTSVTLNSAGTAPTATVAGSPYSITPSAAVGTGLSNYTITYSSLGTLTVNSAALTITANNTSKTYGQTLTFAGTEFTPVGLLNSDTVTSVTLNSAGTAPTATVAGSPYSITPSAAVGTGLSNYTITYSSLGTLIVNPAALTITSNNTSKTYGQTLTFAGTEFTPVGLLNSDTVTSVTLNSAGTAPTATVAGSPYSITPSAAVGTGLSNYTITYSSLGTLTVNPAALTITANNTSKTYGQTLTFAGTEFTPTGLLNSDTVTSVTLNSAGEPSNAGVVGSPYSIVPSAAVGSGLSNYAITYDASGTLTVNPLGIIITSDSQTKPFGTTLLPITNLFTTNIVLPNGDTIGTVDIVSTGLSSGAPVGMYSITSVTNATGGTFDANNYSISYNASGNINVVAAPIPPAPPIDLIDVPPTERFTPPVMPNCGTAGCDNVGIILIDLLNGIGIREDIIVYPVGMMPELMYSSDTSNILGIVTDSVGAPSEATNAQGVTRELTVGSVIYKDDMVIAGGNSCVCIETLSRDKKCTSNTKVDSSWSNTCKTPSKPPILRMAS